MSAPENLLLNKVRHPERSDGFNPFRVGAEEKLTQGRRWCANPGRYDCNPAGVVRKADFAEFAP
jgi:hypothetical protein